MNKYMIMFKDRKDRIWKVVSHSDSGDPFWKRDEVEEILSSYAVKCGKENVKLLKIAKEIDYKVNFVEVSWDDKKKVDK